MMSFYSSQSLLCFSIFPLSWLHLNSSRIFLHHIPYHLIVYHRRPIFLALRACQLFSTIYHLWTEVCQLDKRLEPGCCWRILRNECIDSISCFAPSGDQNRLEWDDPGLADCSWFHLHSMHQCFYQKAICGHPGQRIPRYHSCFLFWFLRDQCSIDQLC